MTKETFEAKVKALYESGEDGEYDPKDAHEALDELCWQTLKELGYFDVKNYLWTDNIFVLWYA